MRLLFPNFSAPSIYPQIAGVVATVCLAFIIAQFALRGTEHLEVVKHTPLVHKKIKSPEITGHSTKYFKKQAKDGGYLRQNLFCEKGTQIE